MYCFLLHIRSSVSLHRTPQSLLLNKLNVLPSGRETVLQAQETEGKITGWCTLIIGTYDTRPLHKRYETEW
jgi:hypothetical protein